MTDLSTVKPGDALAIILRRGVPLIHKVEQVKNRTVYAGTYKFRFDGTPLPDWHFVKAHIATQADYDAAEKYRLLNKLENRRVLETLTLEQLKEIEGWLT